MSYIPQSGWDNYLSIMRLAHDTFNQDDLIWLKSTPIVKRYEEQEDLVPTIITLKALMGFNSFRTWPITLQENAGELDNQNMIAILNRTYLGENNWLLPNGYLDFKPDKDYFIHRGIKYKAEGDTFASQAHNTPLHIILILHREELLVGEAQFNQTSAKTVIAESEITQLNILSHDVF